MANPSVASANPDFNDDEDAILAACQADPAAFSQLYQRYLGRVYRYLFFRVGERAVAEDLTSQAFLAALESLPRYRHQGNFAAWLFAIARRKAADYFRQSRGQASLEALQDSLPGEGDPLPQVIAGEQMKSLGLAVSNLAEDEQELLRLRFAAELSFAEIGMLLKRSPAAVKMQLYRLLDRLAEGLKASGLDRQEI
jgi:RNA polymerase sigma-70 factor, ECF subfamily